MHEVFDSHECRHCTFSLTAWKQHLSTTGKNTIVKQQFIFCDWSTWSTGPIKFRLKCHHAWHECTSSELRLDDWFELVISPVPSELAAVFPFCLSGSFQIRVQPYSHGSSEEHSVVQFNFTVMFKSIKQNVLLAVHVTETHLEWNCVPKLWNTVPQFCVCAK